jgi:SnoaL-like domain
MNIEALEARLQALEDKNRHLQDVEEIKKLQRIYGYYVERGQLDEVVDLFSDSPDVSFGPSYSVMVGKDNVRSMFSSQKPFGVFKGTKPDDYLHITMPVSGVVDVAVDGKTAKARWYALMYLCNATPGGGAVIGVGMYENEYIKEDGKWKILRLQFDDIFLSPYEDGWAKTPKLWGRLEEIANSVGLQPGDVPDPPPSKSPFGDPMPFHYEHPITGK